MTKEEIKRVYSMRNIVERYGFHPNRAGFISCPFHQKDKNPSMKIYDNDFHCFACGAHGDIFTFIERMDGLSFREAFLELGGQYQKKSVNFQIYHAQKQREMQKKRREELKKKRELNNKLIDIYRENLERATPLTDEWGKYYNLLQYQIYLNEYLNEEEDV